MEEEMELPRGVEVCPRRQLMGHEAGVRTQVSRQKRLPSQPLNYNLYIHI